MLDITKDIQSLTTFYRISEARKEVDVLHIRHGARQAFKKDDLK